MVDEKSKRRRATFLEWCMLAAIALTALAIVSRLVWADWNANGIPEWYATYLRWQQRHGIYWLPF